MTVRILKCLVLQLLHFSLVPRALLTDPTASSGRAALCLLVDPARLCPETDLVDWNDVVIGAFGGREKVDVYAICGRDCDECDVPAVRSMLAAAFGDRVRGIPLAACLKHL